jgi:hypothetical protein
MRMSYQFNEKTDAPDDKWGMSAETLLADIVTTNRSQYYNYGNRKGIEEKISSLTEAMGGLADLLISKGLISPDDFLLAIGGSSVYEVREHKDF